MQTIKVLAVLAFGLVIVSIPVLFYGTIAVVVIHFIKKWW